MPRTPESRSHGARLWQEEVGFCIERSTHTPTYFEELPVGTVFDLGEMTLSDEQIIAFGREYDPQSFHVDPDAAAAGPHGGLIASGLHTFGVFSRLFADKVMKHLVGVSGAGVEGMRWKVPVRPGDTLRGRATVIEGTRPSVTKPDRGIVVVRAELENQRGELVWVAEIASVVARRP